MSGPGTGKVYPLKDSQAAAVNPRDSVWLSASAGTGKTQVLSARVLRLLLEEGVRPEHILCLTFTKAGAAEMATRVNEVLANWVRLPNALLAKDLIAIGAPNDEATIARARTLFAAVLDCPGGGLRIDTIHAFSQWLLAAFPQEAGLIPGTRPMEDRDRDLLADRVLRELLLDWQEGDPEAVAALEMLSVRMGPADAQGWLMRCAGYPQLWHDRGGWQPPLEPRVRRLLGLAADATRTMAAQECADGVPGVELVRKVMWAYDEWGTSSAQTYAGHVGEWLLLGEEERFACAGALLGQLYNKEGKLKYQSNLEKKVAGVEILAEDARLWLEGVAERAMLFELVEFLTPALSVGRKFAIAWAKAKAREGLVDFDDLIARAAELLQGKTSSDWIRYKLDRQFDHILVDEAQDTNQAQWDIIDALTDDFFAGQGQADDKLRTIFVVGDYKQAIFRFQGTSPENFRLAREQYRLRLDSWVANVATSRTAIDARPLRQLGLGRSYRTAKSILQFVDDAIAAIGPEQIGLDHVPEPHVGEDRPGMVTLWKPVPGKGESEADGDEDDAPAHVSAPEQQMAKQVALSIKRMWEGGFPLVKDKDNPRNATPGDFMVLVRKRGKEFASSIVAQLHALKVPVAGVDRLRLGAPLAVKDLMAALRFAAQPADDLSLACLLVSPIIGWSQDDLLEHAPRPYGKTLWSHLRDSETAKPAEAVAMLDRLLEIADYEPPQALLHWMLLGPWRARAKLVARLGGEANDPIDELLGAAQQFAAANTPSLHGFIRWFDSGDGELKREAEGPGGQVRVMTVHGSKGLQAPIVILADACGNPDQSRASDLELVEALPGGEDGRKVPLPGLRGEEKVGPIGVAAEALAEAEREEHWRLLYVAMTRAEEALFIGGALGKGKLEPPENSWYAALAPLFPEEELADDVWGWRRERGSRAEPIGHKTQAALPLLPTLPKWATTPIGPEPRPPRPLAPSASADDTSADPPLPPEQAAVAARRGVLIHALLERLPDVPADMREGAARGWLARQAADLTEAEREEMIDRAVAVMDAPDWRDLFGPDALAEVPLAATVGTQVIAGTADRLLITESRVLVADFKTARRPPGSLEQVPESTLKQMAAYVAALSVIYPDRAVEAAVLYTQTPQLIAIPAERLAAYQAALSTA